MTSPSDQSYLLQMAQKSVLGTPTEYDAYGVITEAFILHKQPRNRYTIFPQLFLRWNPQDADDTRGSLPDFGLGRYHDVHPHVRLQGGVEVKKATSFMLELPPPNIVAKDDDVMNVLQSCEMQADDQAKAAVKGGLLPPNVELLWLMFVGPYFAIIKVGPFTAAQLKTRGHKPNESGDFLESIVLKGRRLAEPIVHDLYLLGTPEAAAKIEFFINSTTGFLPQP